MNAIIERLKATCVRKWRALLLHNDVREMSGNAMVQSFTLVESDLETNTDSMKFYCRWVSVRVNSSIQFHTGHLLLGLGVGLGLGRSEHTVRFIEAIH